MALVNCQGIARQSWHQDSTESRKHMQVKKKKEVEPQDPWREIIFLLIPLHTRSDLTLIQAKWHKKLELTSLLERMECSVAVGIWEAPLLPDDLCNLALKELHSFYCLLCTFSKGVGGSARKITGLNNASHKSIGARAPFWSASRFIFSSGNIL